MDSLSGPRALTEIVERHRFFERWFNGEADEDEVARSLDRFDSRFQRVDPAGRLSDKAALASALAARRGSRRTDPVRIAIEEAHLIWQAPSCVVVAYVEAQSSASTAAPERRRSTALFFADPEGRALRWRHVQETLIRSDGPPSPVAPEGTVT